jgi:hypothetical protein
MCCRNIVNWVDSFVMAAERGETQRGRPKLPSVVVRRRRVSVNIKASEWRELRSRAKATGCSMSDYLRRLLDSDLKKPRRK